MNTLNKRCADALRVFSENHGVKLKASHAHEIVAAFFGYKSKAAMDADNSCSMDNLGQANIYVLTPSAFIDERRQCLEGLPSDLPHTHALNEAIIPALGEVFRGRSFASFPHLAKVLTGDYLQKHGHSLLPSNFGTFEKAHRIFSKPLYEFDPKIENADSGVILMVSNRYHGSVDVGFHPIDVTITIGLKRVAGRVGYTLLDISAESSTSNTNRRLA